MSEQSTRRTSEDQSYNRRFSTCWLSWILGTDINHRFELRLKETDTRIVSCWLTAIVFDTSSRDHVWMWTMQLKSKVRWNDRRHLAQISLVSAYQTDHFILSFPLDQPNRHSAPAKIQQCRTVQKTESISFSFIFFLVMVGVVHSLDVLNLYFIRSNKAHAQSIQLASFLSHFYIEMCHLDRKISFEWLLWNRSKLITLQWSLRRKEIFQSRWTNFGLEWIWKWPSWINFECDFSSKLFFPRE